PTPRRGRGRRLPRGWRRAGLRARAGAGTRRLGRAAARCPPAARLRARGSYGHPQLPFPPPPLGDEPSLYRGGGAPRAIDSASGSAAETQSLIPTPFQASPPRYSPLMRDNRPSTSATTFRWPTWYCGIALSQRMTSARTGV